MDSVLLRLCRFEGAMVMVEMCVETDVRGADSRRSGVASR